MLTFKTFFVHKILKQGEPVPGSLLEAWNSKLRSIKVMVVVVVVVVVMVAETSIISMKTIRRVFQTGNECHHGLWEGGIMNEDTFY
jgi:RsiW-degrading membrane proteinase PrsW (M82 family)